MKINNKIFKAVFALLAVLAAALAFFRFDMLNGNKAIDELGLYTDKSAGTLFGALVFILIAVTAVFALILSKNSFEPKKANVFRTVSSVLCMLLLLSTGISLGAELLEKPNPVLSATGQTTGGFNILLAIEVLCIFASVVYFLIESISGAKQASKDKYSILALLPVTYLAIRAIRLFMNIENQINSSERSFTLLFIVVIMMFFISEAEHSIPLGSLEKTDEANSKRVAKYAGFGIVSVELAIIFVITAVIVNHSDSAVLIRGLSDMAIALFAAINVLSVKTK